MESANLSTTEDVYNTRLSKFEKKFPLPPIRCVKETWLIHKEKFIVVWTQQYLHLGNSATKRVEGSHAFLERHLRASTGDMLLVSERTSQALQAQHSTLEYVLARDQIEKVIVPTQEVYTTVPPDIAFLYQTYEGYSFKP